MRRLVLASLLAAVVSMPAVAAERAKEIGITSSVMTLRVDGDLVIDPTGKVVEYSIDSPTTAELHSLLQRSVAKWSFKPTGVTANGQPANAKVPLRITLLGTPVADGYSLTVDNVVFGKPNEAAKTQKTELGAKDGPAMPDAAASQPPAPVITPKKLTAGGYPKGLMMAGVEGGVMLYLRLSPSGTVEDVVAVQSALYNVRGRPETLDRARKLLEDNTIAFAKRWTFEVKPGSKPLTAEDLTVGIPVAYTMHGKDSDAPGKWRVELRSERRLVPWLLDSKSIQAIGISDVDLDAGLQPLASTMQAPEGVIGKAL